MPGILYICDICDEDSESQCYEHSQVRLTKDGDWICECCFDGTPEWSYANKPENWNDAEFIFRWNMLPKVPRYVPAEEIG